MLDDTIDELRTVALEAVDGSGYFPAMYARVTDRIRSATADGRFGDREGMVRFAQAFASWYLRPMSGDGPVPRCWQATRDVAGDRRLLIVQHLLLGINAHVNHDLPQVVVELAGEHGDLGRMRHDFDAVNDVLAETMPDVLRDLGRASRWVNLVAARGGSRLFDFSLETARAQAWRSAERLDLLGADGRSADVAELDRLVSVLAYLVAHPGRPAAWLVHVGRWFEDDDPQRVSRSLLGPLA
jgi:hypothetical protein